jgi:hypothetical protein
MHRRLAPLAASAVVGMIFAVHLAAQDPSPAAPPVTPVSSVTKVDPHATPLPSTKDLLEKFATVSGGRGVWAGFTTRYLKGIYQTEDASGFAAIEIFSKSPNKALFKITFSNGVVIRECATEKPRGSRIPPAARISSPARPWRAASASQASTTAAMLS